MPVTNSWGDEAKTILVNDFQGQWTWEEFEAGVLRGFELIKTVDHPVYVIAQNFTNTPKGNAMAAFRRVENFPANLALLIIHSEGFNPIGRVLINTFLRVYGRQAGKVLYVDSMDNAYKAVEKHHQQSGVRQAVS
jgi:hypothetical protein